MSEPAKPSVQVIERLFLLLEVLAKNGQAMSLKEISEAAKLHPSTTHRILNDLTIGRFVERPEAGSYRLGKRRLECGTVVKVRPYIHNFDHSIFLTTPSARDSLTKNMTASG